MPPCTPHYWLVCQLDMLSIHPHRMDDRGSVKQHTPVGNHGCFNTQTRARDTPIALVAGRWLLALLLRLASAPPWARLPLQIHIGPPYRSDMHVPGTNRDGQAGGAPLSPRQVPGAPKWARGARGDTQEMAKSSLHLFFWRLKPGLKPVLCLHNLL
jgi:hypothetical protein